MNKYLKLNIKNFDFGNDTEIRLNLKYLNLMEMENMSYAGKCVMSLAWSIYKNQKIFENLKWC